jgi:hypothetical protein
MDKRCDCISSSHVGEEHQHGHGAVMLVKNTNMGTGFYELNENEWRFLTHHNG